MHYRTCSRYMQYRIHKPANRWNIQQKYSILTSELAWDYFIVIDNSLKPLIRAEFHSIISSVTHAAHWRCSSATSLSLLSYLLPAYINKKAPSASLTPPFQPSLHCFKGWPISKPDSRRQDPLLSLIVPLSLSHCPWTLECMKLFQARSRNGPTPVCKRKPFYFLFKSSAFFPPKP